MSRLETSISHTVLTALVCVAVRPDLGLSQYTYTLMRCVGLTNKLCEKRRWSLLSFLRLRVEAVCAEIDKLAGQS